MTVFDEDYYTRHYGDEATRVTDAATTARLAEFICAYLRYLHIEVDEVLDLGCGVGLWRDPIARCLPDARYRGVENAEHACAQYGWERGSIVDYAGPPAELVVCQGVLHYLDARQARAGIRTLTRVAPLALYLEILTQEDWEENVNQTLTDLPRKLRPVSWYRELLHPHFRSVGGGLFLAREADVALFELEALT